MARAVLTIAAILLLQPIQLVHVLSAPQGHARIFRGYDMYNHDPVRYWYRFEDGGAYVHGTNRGFQVRNAKDTISHQDDRKKERGSKHQKKRFALSNGGLLDGNYSVHWEEHRGVVLQGLVHHKTEDGHNTKNVKKSNTSPYDAEINMHGADRIKVRKSRYPFDLVGIFDNGCTGTLVGPCHVLTAGHCVYDPVEKQWAFNLGFTPGRNGPKAWSPNGRAEYVGAHALVDWQLMNNYSADIALVVVDWPIGYYVGMMPFGHGDSGEEMGLNMAGYPIDKPEGEMWFDYCDSTTFDYEDQMVYHSCTSKKGNSGSPLWTYRRSDRLREIRAVHTGTVNDVSNLFTGRRGHVGSEHQPYGVLLNREHAETIQHWIEQSPCQS